MTNPDDDSAPANFSFEDGVFLFRDGVGSPATTPEDSSPPPPSVEITVAPSPVVAVANSDADLARREGWTPGTTLEGEDQHSIQRIVLTAVGESKVLARLDEEFLKTEKVWIELPPMQKKEKVWTFGFRVWKKAAASVAAE